MFIQGYSWGQRRTFVDIKSWVETQHIISSQQKPFPGLMNSLVRTLETGYKVAICSRGKRLYMQINLIADHILLSRTILGLCYSDFIAAVTLYAVSSVLYVEVPPARRKSRAMKDWQRWHHFLFLTKHHGTAIKAIFLRRTHAQVGSFLWMPPACITYPYRVHMFAHHIVADERWSQHDINLGKSISGVVAAREGVPYILEGAAWMT